MIYFIGWCNVSTNYSIKYNQYDNQGIIINSKIKPVSCGVCEEVIERDDPQIECVKCEDTLHADGMEFYEGRYTYSHGCAIACDHCKNAVCSEEISGNSDATSVEYKNQPLHRGDWSGECLDCGLFSCGDCVRVTKCDSCGDPLCCGGTCWHCGDFFCNEDYTECVSCENSSCYDCGLESPECPQELLLDEDSELYCGSRVCPFCGSHECEIKPDSQEISK